MRAAAAGVVLVLGTTTGTALPAQAADPAPTAVTVAWASAAHTHVRVTWSEATPVPNRVVTTGNHIHYRTAEEPNQLDVATSELAGQSALRITVYAGDQSGPTSPGTVSAPFDTLGPPQPVIDLITARPGNSFTVKWHSLPAADPNPGDPLDLVSPHRYQVFASLSKYTVWDPKTPPSPATEATFTATDNPPFGISVRDHNEWGEAYAVTSFAVDYERFGGLTIPASTTYGQPTVISGVLHRIGRICDPGPCWEERVGEEPRLVVLHARADATSPWYAVGSVLSQARGEFRFAPVALGTRQYRVAVPDDFGTDSLGLGVVSGAATTLTRPRVTAGFTDSTVTAGQRVTTRVTLAPAANIRTTLQRWDGTAWRDQKWVTTSGGAGSYTFTATRRGRFAYRYLVPNFTHAGRPLAWQVSANFVLTVS